MTDSRRKGSEADQFFVGVYIPGGDMETKQDSIHAIWLLLISVILRATVCKGWMTLFIDTGEVPSFNPHSYLSHNANPCNLVN